MKNTCKLACCIALLGVISLPACKKKETVADKFVGKWRWTYLVVDSNANNIMDASEYMSVPDGDYITFNGGGSGIITGSSGDLPFSWKLINGDADLVREISGSAGGDIDTVRISSITNTDLVFGGPTVSSAGSPVMWTVMKKQ